MLEITYAPRGGLFGDPCWKATTTKEDGQTITVRYKRIVAGVALPKADQPQGAAVVLAEIYNAKKGAPQAFAAPTAFAVPPAFATPPAFTALAGLVGLWPELEQGLGELRRVFWVETFVTEPDEAAVDDLRRVPGLRYASGQIPSAVLPAPAHALGETSGEIARQKVNQLGHEGRLTLGPVKAILDEAGEPARLALQCVVIWLLEHPATYKAGLRIKGPSYGWSHPGGEPSGPFDREG